MPRDPLLPGCTCGTCVADGLTSDGDFCDGVMEAIYGRFMTNEEIEIAHENASVDEVVKHNESVFAAELLITCGPTINGVKHTLQISLSLLSELVSMEMLHVLVEDPDDYDASMTSMGAIRFDVEDGHDEEELSELLCGVQDYEPDDESRFVVMMPECDQRVWATKNLDTLRADFADGRIRRWPVNVQEEFLRRVGR